MKKVFSLAFLFASVNCFFADGDTSREPVAESNNVVLEKQQNSKESLDKFFLELGVNVGASNSSFVNKVNSDSRHMTYHFAFGGTIAPYYVFNDKYSFGLEFGINRTQSAKFKGNDSDKFDLTHYSYLAMVKYNACPCMYVKFGLGVANSSLRLRNVDNCTYNVLKMGPAAEVAVGYNVWKNVNLELGYKYYRVNGKSIDEGHNYRMESQALSFGVSVML